MATPPINPRPHYLLNAIAGWRTAASANVAFSADGGALTLQPLPGGMRPLIDAAGSFGGLQTAIGVAVDPEDNVYILDAGLCAVKRFDRCTQAFVRLHCVGGCGAEPRQMREAHGIAISRNYNLYLADTGNFRVQVFALNELVLRSIWGPFQVKQAVSGYTINPAIPAVRPPAKGCAPQWVYPAGTWRPWDVAIAPDGTICVSDYANGLIHFFDSVGCWEFASNGAAAGQPALVKPTRIAVDKAGRVYVIQENVGYVVVLDADGSYLQTISQPQQIAGDFRPVAVAVDLNGNLCLSDCLTRKLYFYQPVGDGSWCPFRCCGGAEGFATSLVFDRTGAPLFTGGGQSVCQMEPAAAYPTSGTYLAGPLDSRTYKCVWHRVVVSGPVPQGASVRVDTFTSESAKTVNEVESLPPSRWATGLVDTDTDSCEWDCLVLSPPGRYLWLRLTLAGDGAETAEIDTIRVYYPRASALRYLPAVYSADAVSADFLDRFLSIFDTMSGAISERVTYIARYFDPMATPANPKNVGGTDFLSYLSSWIGMTLNSNWPVHRRRELVRNAYRLYALRGTSAGLRLAIELYTGVKPTILEMFRLRSWLIVNQSTLGNCSTVFGAEVMDRLQIGSNSTIGGFRLIDYGDPNLDIFNEYANQFLVIVPRWAGADESAMQTLQQIVQMAQPAHTLATIQWAEPRMRIGIQSFVGVDTIVGRYPLGVIEGQGKLGYDTVLGVPGEKRRAPSMQVGRNASVGSSSVLH
jgi:phage tail-like protein